MTAEEQKQEIERLKEQIKSLSARPSGSNRKRGVAEPHVSHRSGEGGAEKKTRIETTEVQTRQAQEVPQLGRDQESMRNDEGPFSAAFSIDPEANGSSLVNAGSDLESSGPSSTDQALPVIMQEEVNEEGEANHANGGSANLGEKDVAVATCSII